MEEAVTDLTAGPELDRLVAVGPMGWKPLRAEGRRWVREDGTETNYIVGGHDLGFCPSTNIAHAWEVVEKLKHIGIGFQVQSCGARGWLAVCGSALSGASGFCDTAPHAICLAALKAVGE